MAKKIPEPTINGKPKNSFKLNVRRRQSSGRTISNNLGKSVTSFFHGWRAYYRQQPVFYAGLSLALLYLTVLGLDGITTVFIYSQGLQENVVALARGAGALVGILGTVAFSGVRKRWGLTKTGIFALGTQLSCNALTALSIWLPGSPFDPYGYFFGSESPASSPINVPSIYYRNNTVQFPSNSSDIHGKRYSLHDKPMHSILVFLTGIVLARFGLWMVDLTITQTMQEHVADHERGVIGGVQHSLNQCLNMFKDILVILMPDPRTFGLLILISCFSVFSGFVSYLVYASKAGFSTTRRVDVSNENGADNGPNAKNGTRGVDVLEVEEIEPLKKHDQTETVGAEPLGETNNKIVPSGLTRAVDVPEADEALPWKRDQSEN